MTCKAVQAPGVVVADDAFAKGFSYDSLDKLKEALRANIEREYARLSRERLKRALLDALDKKYSFELPEGLVAQEFESIWRQAEAEQKQSGRSFADEGTTEEAARADYRKIAERRVRLGLVLAEVGEKAGVKVSDEEMSQALFERVRQFPGREKEVWEYHAQEPGSARPSPRTALRGQGRRSHPLDGQSHRAAGVARRARADAGLRSFSGPGGFLVRKSRSSAFRGPRDGCLDTAVPRLAKLRRPRRDDLASTAAGRSVEARLAGHLCERPSDDYFA